MTPRPFVLLVAGLVFVSGCQGCFGCSTSPVDGNGSTLPRDCQSTVPDIAPQKLDILFVVDNSSSMTSKQERVAEQLITFVDELHKAGGLRKDFHVGVITTSVYLHGHVSYPDGGSGPSFWRTADYANQSGRLMPIPDRVPLPDGGVFYNTVTKNQRFIDGDDPELVDKFTRLVHQGDTGSGQETPFEAVKLALLSDLATTPMAAGGNAEFFRDGARLLIVVVSDEDDCSETNRPSIVTIGSDLHVDDCLNEINSETTVSDYYDRFIGSHREILWAAIAPVGRSTNQVQLVDDGIAVRNIDCPDSFAPGFRHKAMAEMFDPELKNLGSVCNASYQETLLRIADQAGVSQRLDLTHVPDPGMLQLVLTRRDGTQKVCTLAQGADGGNDGFDLLTDGVPVGTTRIQFKGDCLRRANDTNVEVRMLCAM